MAISSIREPRPAVHKGIVPFALGFRPFFLAAGLTGTVLLPLWLLIYAGLIPAPSYYGPFLWHGHEMVFGYAAAVIAGFLLTAVRNWTGVDTPTGWPLAGLALLWLAGRVAPFLPLPGWLIAAVDLAFLPTLAVAVLIPLLRVRQAHNYPFPVVLALLTAASALSHPAVAGAALNLRGLYFGVDVVALLIVVMGGRVIPFFIERAVPGAERRQWRLVEVGAIVSAVLVVVTELAMPGSWGLALAATAAGLFNGIRLAGWHHRRLWREPLLWVLWLGYGWLAAGYLLKGLAPLGLLTPSTALHALTAGAIGVLTLGMMARVAIGHTGRTMRTLRGMAPAFALANLGALMRVLAPLAGDSGYLHAVTTAGVLWSLALLIFTVIYLPILVRPRIDGMPG